VKTFFNEYLVPVGEDAQQLENEIDSFLRRIFNIYIAKGYSPREISHLVTTSTTSEESMRVLLRASFMRKNLRKENK